MPKKTRLDETKMQERAKELHKFRLDFAGLRKRFTLNELAQITGINISNLSSYGSGSKNPGPQIIEAFYAKMKPEIDELSRVEYSKAVEKQDSVVESEPFYYRPTKQSKDINNDLIQSLITINDQIRSNYEKMLENFDRIIAVNEQLASSNVQLALNNIRLINKLLPGRQMLNRRTGPKIAKKNQ